MHEHDQISLAVARHVGHDGFAGFEGIVAAGAKRALFKNLPAGGRDQLVRQFESHQVQVVLFRFQKDQVLAPIIVEIADDYVR